MHTLYAHTDTQALNYPIALPAPLPPYTLALGPSPYTYSPPCFPPSHYHSILVLRQEPGAVDKQQSQGTSGQIAWGSWQLVVGRLETWKLGAK